MRRLLGALPVLLLVAAACTYIGGQTEPYQPPGIREIGKPETGREWYQRDCAWCHGDRGAGTTRGPSLIGDDVGPALVHFMLTTGRMPIEDPTNRVRPGEPIYDDRTIDAIVEYVRSLGATGPEIPEVHPARGDIAVGEQLYQEHCAPCHSATGIGGTLTQGKVGDVGGDEARRSGFQVPGLGGVNAEQVAEAMVSGPGTMPVFPEEMFTQEEIDSLARYVLYLRNPENQGGGDLGRVGPVAEGAVAWIVALGAILVLARWIGKRIEHE